LAPTPVCGKLWRVTGTVATVVLVASGVAALVGVLLLAHALTRGDSGEHRGTGHAHRRPKRRHRDR
jgi:hypothetical protein